MVLNFNFHFKTAAEILLYDGAIKISLGHSNLQDADIIM